MEQRDIDLLIVIDKCKEVNGNCYICTYKNKCILYGAYERSNDNDNKIMKLDRQVREEAQKKYLTVKDLEKTFQR